MSLMLIGVAVATAIDRVITVVSTTQQVVNGLGEAILYVCVDH